MNNKILSMYDISQRILEGEDFKLALGDFLDIFYSSTDIIKKEMINEPPLDLPQIEQVPILAATAHKLSNDFSIKAPNWVFEPRCYLSSNTPYFGIFTKTNYKIILMVVSPPEFKHRNIFVSRNTLTRV